MDFPHHFSAVFDSQLECPFFSIFLNGE